MFKISSMRGFISGDVSANELMNEAASAVVTEDNFTDEDMQLITETLAETMPYLISDDILIEACERGEGVFQEAMTELQSYLKTNGLLSESFSMSNPKKNYVRLNKIAILERLKSIFTIKLARKAKHKAYKKYKIGTKIKRNAFEDMKKVFGVKAGMLAKKAIQMKNNKTRIASVLDIAKSK